MTKRILTLVRTIFCSTGHSWSVGCVWHWQDGHHGDDTGEQDELQGILRTVPVHTNCYRGARTDHSQPGNGASSDCCWLKSVLKVCQCDETILLPCLHPRAPIAEKIRDSSSCLVLVLPYNLLWHSKVFKLQLSISSQLLNLWQKGLPHRIFLCSEKNGIRWKDCQWTLLTPFPPSAHEWCTAGSALADFTIRVSAFDGHWSVTRCTDCNKTNLLLARFIKT